ncbi:efflux RND transporter periplasmic adaptor subunit [Gluconacetobacter sacchari]|uniref:efflux RND transporter periplasmic adaptor subunit n=1 Tax=Gluconacetobacter sacchari TaxID=92759 RepID=UPI0039B414FC
MKRVFFVILSLTWSDRSYAQDVPQAVSTVTANMQTWRPAFVAIGNLQAHYGTDLAFQTPGLLSEIDFHSGTDVAAGTTLARLQLNDEPGLLAQYEAQAALDEIVLNRDSKQFLVSAVSRAVVDHDRLTLQADRARTDSERGIIAMKTLRTPFAGRLGVRQVNPGQYLQPGTVVVTLQALDPIFADFYVPQNLAGTLATGQEVSVHADAWRERTFPGRVTAITPQVDPQSRTILVRATLDNHDRALIPGMFVTVNLINALPEQRLTLPKSAIVYTTYGDSVWLVRPSGDARPATVHQISVQAADSRGDQVAIRSGLKTGDVVVSAGQTKLYEGASIKVDNTVEPDGAADPHPAEE